MTSREIIIKPIITEKSMTAISDRKYTFRVDKRAGKIEIAKAVEELFGVKVTKVCTINVRGHLRRQGATQGYTQSWKKAIVTISEDSKPIEFFEGII